MQAIVHLFILRIGTTSFLLYWGFGGHRGSSCGTIGVLRSVVNGALGFHTEPTIAKNQNTYAKRQREQEKKQRADDKRAKRDRKNGGGGNTPAPMHRFFTRPDDQDNQTE